MSASQFFDDLPYHPPLFTTAKGLAIVHLVAERGVVALKWLAAVERGSGRAALTLITEAADRHGVTLDLIARPQPSAGAGKTLTPEKLEAFYEGFGFVTKGRSEFAWMERKAKK